MIEVLTDHKVAKIGPKVAKKWPKVDSQEKNWSMYLKKEHTTSKGQKILNEIYAVLKFSEKRTKNEKLSLWAS
jgi:hypothetical protein